MSVFQRLMSKYIVVGAPFSIQCNNDIKDYIYSHINPPFEEPFDLAEEHILSVLFDAWSTLLSKDIVTFEKVHYLNISFTLVLIFLFCYDQAPLGVCIAV